MISKRIKLLCDTPELIENYDEATNDKTQMWDCHHRLEITENGDFISCKELIKMNLYFHRPPEELIFLTKSEHKKLHHKDPDFRNKISKTMKSQCKGEGNPFYGKHHSEETRKLQSFESHRRHWYNNGEKETFSIECPNGFVPGRLKR
jgi:hypothetical protein